MNPDAQEGEERLGEDRARNQEHHRNDDRPHRVGEQVAQQNLEIARPGQLGGEGVFLMLEADDLRTGDARRADPRGQAQRNQDGADVRAHEHHQQDGVQQGRQGDDDIDDAHHHVIDLAAEIARDAAVEHADDHVDQRGDHADGKADARAVEHADIQIAAERVRAEPMRLGRPLGDGEEIGLVIRIRAKHRPEDGEQGDDEDHNQTEHGQLILAEAPPCVLPIGNGRTGNLVGGDAGLVQRLITGIFFHNILPVTRRASHAGR